jgi:aminotransferase
MPFAVALAQRAQVLSGRLPDLPPFPPSPVASPAVRAAVEAALDRGETHYTDRPGILPLREKVAALLEARFGLKTDAKTDLVVTCGVTEARFVAIQQLLTPGDSLAAPSDPARLFGPTLLRGATVAPDVTPESPVVHLTSSTPEATMWDRILAMGPNARLIYEIDEPDSGFHPAQIKGYADRTFTIGDLGSGSWRIGYLASPASFSAGLRDFKQALTICTTNLSQWAALAAMEAP